MTTLARTSPILADLSGGKPISEGAFAYFEALLSNQLHEVVLSLFEKLSEQEGLTRAELARRMGKDPAQITRFFGTPGNWELATVSRLLLAMGHKLKVSAVPAAAILDPDDSITFLGSRTAVTAHRAFATLSSQPPKRMVLSSPTNAEESYVYEDR